MSRDNYDWKKSYEDWCGMTYALLSLEEAEKRISEVDSVEKYRDCIKRLEELQLKSLKALESFEGSSNATYFEMVVRDGYLTSEEYDELMHLEWLIC